MQTGRNGEFGLSKVLLVEDDRLIRQILYRMLKGIGIGEIVEAESAESAWLHLSGPHGGSFCLVVTDLTLPGASGATLIKSLRKLREPQPRDIPVIVLTGSTDSAAYLQVEDCGISSYLIKPITLEILREAICNALEPQGRAIAADC